MKPLPIADYLGHLGREGAKEPRRATKSRRSGPRSLQNSAQNPQNVELATARCASLARPTPWAP